ncbi:MAG: N-methylhydantoinase, partial [Phenylobacterium sp.]|nr:N-methylhydantoinase [Phenylobacterium sp.]
GASGPGTPKGERAIPLWTGAPKAKLYDRTSLCEGQTIVGPALIEERETTVVLPPGWTGVVDAIGCITARRNP